MLIREEEAAINTVLEKLKKLILRDSLKVVISKEKKQYDGATKRAKNKEQI